jgi:nitrogen fixation NifU-like protein
MDNRNDNAGGAPNDSSAEELFGRMNDPTAAAWVKGPCGDSMEFYLVIRADSIEDVRFYSEGCGNTLTAGRAVARRARGRRVTDALSISAGEIIRAGECDPDEGRHCAILAVTTLYRAIADYLLQP